MHVQLKMTMTGIVTQSTCSWIISPKFTADPNLMTWVISLIDAHCHDDTQLAGFYDFQKKKQHRRWTFLTDVDHHRMGYRDRLNEEYTFIFNVKRKHFI